MPPITRFPDPRRTTPEGVLAVGGDLEPESLELAYSQGIFPWPMDEHPLVWFCPPTRAILEFSELHIPKSLKRRVNQPPFTFTVDQAFSEVIRACSEAPRPGQHGTWITPEMIDAYVELHRRGRAHSVEAWDGTALVGGIYGVDAGGAFAGESMFYRKPYASKLALLHLVEHLRTRGLDWIDIQVMTPHMEALGAREISRDEFLRKLARTRASRLRLF